MLRRTAITAAIAAAVLIIVAPGRASGATPTPSATTTPTGQTASPTPAAATPSPLPPGAVQVIVFNDLDGDGVRDDGEPGLEGWRLIHGCSDAIVPLTTDRNGVAVAGDRDGCFHLYRQFGWLPTRGVDVKVTPEQLAGGPVLFGFHDYGRGVMELLGEAIAHGLPMMQGDPGLAEPYRSCGHLFVEGSGPALTQVVVIVESAVTRAGCPQSGDEITPSLGGPAAAGPALLFASGATAVVNWVENGDSLRLYTFDVTEAWVFDPATARLAQHCAVTVPLAGGLTPPGFERVFVVSDEVRPGCGAPGRQVRLLRGDALLDPVLDWQAGSVTQTPRFVVAPVQPVSAPDAGDGATATATESHALISLAVALAALACAATAGGVMLRRR